MLTDGRDRETTLEQRGQASFQAAAVTNNHKRLHVNQTANDIADTAEELTKLKLISNKIESVLRTIFLAGKFPKQHL